MNNLVKLPLNWRTLPKEEQERMMWKCICKLTRNELCEVAGVEPGDLRDDIMEFAGEDDEVFTDTMDHLEEILGDKFYD